MSRKNGNPDRGGDRAAQFGKIDSGASEIVKQAAEILDDQMASGIVAAKAMRARFDQERRLDPTDFKDALAKLRDDSHSVIRLMSHQLSQLRSDENHAIVERFVGRAHELLDLAVDTVGTATELANQVLGKTVPKPTAK